MTRRLAATGARCFVKAAKAPVVAVRWVGRQIRGFAAGVREVTNASHGDAAPAWWTRMAEKAVMGFPELLGLSGEPSDQIYASVFVGVVSVLLGSVFPPLLVVTGLMVLPFLMGVVRLVPAVERGYSSARDAATDPVTDRIRRGR